METRIATQTGMEMHIATVVLYTAVRLATHSSNGLYIDHEACDGCFTRRRRLAQHVPWYMVSRLQMKTLSGCARAHAAGCVNGPCPALAPKFTNRFHFDQALQYSVPPFAVIPHLAIRTYPTLEICLTGLRATGASQLHHQHHFRLTSCTPLQPALPTNADLVAFVAD